MMECNLSYKLIDVNDQVFESSDETEASLSEERLRLKAPFGETLSVPYRDILVLSGSDYKIQVTIKSGDKLILYNLGYRYEDFLRELSKHHNAIILKDMLIQEKPKKSDIEGVFSFLDENGEQKYGGACELQIYETAIVIIPEMGEIIRVPHSYIKEISEEDYTLIIETEFGEKIKLSMLGANFNTLKRALTKMMHELISKSQSALKQLLPDANPLIIRKAARVMREGKAARRADIESISHELWKELEKKLTVLGIKEEYEYLKLLSQQDKICIGLKRGLMGDLTGEYIWFLIPIYSTETGKLGNAVAMEATTGEGGGKATYFFRIVSRKEYPRYADIEELHEDVDDLISTINRCMLEINFRREPIYLQDESLQEPRYARYRYAVERMPALRTLRRLFIGRVSHLSSEQWRKDVMDLLRFNIEADEDDVKWKKVVP